MIKFIKIKKGDGFVITIDELSTKLITYRIANNLTQVQCARKFGISNSTLCHIEKKNATITPKTLIKVNMLIDKFGKEE